MGRREIALTGGSIDGDLPRVLNGASDGVQSAADRALQMTDPAMSFVGASDVLVEVRPGLAVRPERLLAGGIVQPHAVPGAKYGQRQSGQPHEKHQLSGRPGQSTAGHVRFTLAGWRKSQQPAHGQLPPLAPRAVRVCGRPLRSLTITCGRGRRSSSLGQLAPRSCRSCGRRRLERYTKRHLPRT